MTNTHSSRGAELIRLERLRQVAEEGYAPANDHGRSNELVEAASAYASVAILGASAWHNPDGSFSPPGGWPWDDEDYKPANDAVRDLTKAGALIAAAIDALLADEPVLAQKTTN